LLKTDEILEKCLLLFFYNRWKTIRGQCTPLDICGNGVQEQTTVCSKVFDASTNKEDVHLPSKECRKAKIGKQPPTQIPCFIKCTSMYWIYSDWGEVGHVHFSYENYTFLVKNLSIKILIKPNPDSKGYSLLFYIIWFYFIKV